MAAKTDIGRGGLDGWLGLVTRVSKKKGSISLTWKTGPLVGREALVPANTVKVVAKAGSGVAVPIEGGDTNE